MAFCRRVTGVLESEQPKDAPLDSRNKFVYPFSRGDKTATAKKYSKQNVIMFYTVIR